MSEFGKEFAAARKRGDKEFTFDGKKYHTRTKEEEEARKAPKTETPKSAAPAKKSAVETMRDTTAKKYDKDRLEEAKKTATPEPKKEITPRGRMKAAGRKRTEESEPTATAAPGATAVERMKNKMKERYGMKSGGKVSSCSKRADGIAVRGKTKCKMV